VLSDGDDVAVVQLAPAAGLGLAVDEHRARLQQRLGLAAGVHQVGQLQQLAEADDAVACGDLADAAILRRASTSARLCWRLEPWKPTFPLLALRLPRPGAAVARVVALLS
jgi:hypothetical protein